MRIYTLGLLSLILGFTLQAQERLDGVAAMIGDEVILRSEVDAYTLMRLNGLGLDKDSVDISKYRRNFLNELIDGKILLVHAKQDSNIVVGDQEVEQALNNHISTMLEQNNLSIDSLDAVLRREQGTSLTKFKSDARKAIKEQLLKQKVQQSYLYSTKVSRKDVEHFYNQYKDSLPQTGESVLLSKLSLKLAPSDSVRQNAYEKIKSIKRRIDNGADFAEMASKFSEGPEAAEGGDLGFIAKGTLSELTFEEKAFGLTPGQISEPFETRLGFHIINVVSKRDQKVHIRQIFVKVAPPEQQINAIMSRLDTIKAKCQTKESFTTQVKKLSVDQATRLRDGSMGWISLLELPTNIRVAVDTLGPGSITKPVREDNTFSIYRIDDRVKNRALSIDYDYGILAEKAKDILAQRKLIDLVAKWREEIFIDIRI